MVYKSLVFPLVLLFAGAPAAADERKLVDGTEIKDVRFEKGRYSDGRDYIEGSGNVISFIHKITAGDFTIKAKLWLRDLNGTYPYFRIDDNYFCFDSANASLHVNGPKFGGAPVHKIGDASKYFTKGEIFTFEARRRSGKLQILLANQPVYSADYGDAPVNFVAFSGGNNILRIHNWTISGNIEETPAEIPPPAKAAASIQPKVDAAIDKGIRYLLNYQCRDGSWGHRAEMFTGGQTALSAYTLLKCGLPPAHPALQRAFAYLDTLEARETYVVSCLLMAYEAAGNANYKPRMQQLTNTLIGSNDRGLWSYPYEWSFPWRMERGIVDLSNTQFAVLGLRAAHKAGIDVPASVWKQIVESTLRYQETQKLIDASGEHRREGATGTGKISVAGFPYRANEGTYGSMTTAGICIIKICLDHISKTLSTAQIRTLQNSIESGVNWLAENFTVSANPKRGEWIYYYLYGLERVGAFVNIDKIGEHDWYHEGAEFLVKKQGNDGAWAESDHGEADTCFALLFLRRATAPIITGNDTKPQKDLYISEAPANDVNMRGSGQNHLRLWISGFGDNVKKQYGGSGGLRVANIEYFIDGKPAGTVAGDPSKPWTNFKFPFEYEFTTTGKHKISARANLVAPDAAPDDLNPTISIYAAGFEMNVDSVLADWMLGAAKWRGRNLLLNIGKSTTGTTQLNGGETPSHACDGLESTRWLFASGDAKPTLTIELQNSVKANTLVLSQAFNKPASGGMFDKITQIEYVINGFKPARADLDPDDTKPTAIPLGKILTITRIEIRVVARVKSGSQPGVGGLSEVSLENRK